MLDRIFPRQFDNNYRGHWLAIWLFVPLVVARLAMGTNSIINTRMVATTADGIPLDSYGAAGAEAVIALFALSGFFLLLLALQGLVALIRYRAMIPFMYLLLLIQQVGNRALILAHPVAKSGVPSAKLGSAFVLAILAITIAGFVLSLLHKQTSPARDAAI
jgi:hypothetical protein